MRKLVALAACMALGLLPGAASAADADTVPLFAGGGTALSNGFFFPGTAINQGGKLTGVPLQITQGQNIEFVNTDTAAVTNGHAIVSFKRKHGRPLFESGLVNGPATATVITQNLKPGTYSYFCNIHYGMYGLIEVVKS
jgi:hypothetical protein